MTANNLHSQRHAFVSPTNFHNYVNRIDTSLNPWQVPKGTWVRLPLKSRARSRITPGLQTTHNKRHQSPTCPSGHPVTNPLLKSSSRFQVTFVTNSSSISSEYGTKLGYANHGRDCFIFQARTTVLAPRTQSNLRFTIRVSDSPANFQKGIHNGRAGVTDTTFHTYASANLCKTPPPWVVGVAPGHSRDTPGNPQHLVPGLPGVVSP